MTVYGAPPPVGRVMAATDRSETADRAARWAAQLAAAHGAELILFQVLPPADAPAADGQGPSPPAVALETAREALGRFAAELAGPRGRARVGMAPDASDLAGVILGAVEEERADVLVVGNVGMRGRKRFLLGNVPNRISHGARCTVVIVNTGQADQAGEQGGAGNQTGRPALLVVERAAWPDTAATAAMVGTLQEFRDLFDSQALAPGLQLAVERLAFLFTDLSGSTALYQAYGQARAFRLVQDHFRILREAVVAHGGAVVKTIGDAVMAAFPTGAHAVGAALAMQLGIRRLEVAGPVDPARLLKVGIHEGPCIAVGANGRLDYFGTTINLAARVEHESQGGEVVMTAEVYEEPTVAERLRRAGLQAEPAETRLRGVREPVRLYRIREPVPRAATG